MNLETLAFFAIFAKFSVASKFISLVNRGENSPNGSLDKAAK